LGADPLDGSFVPILEVAQLTAIPRVYWLWFLTMAFMFAMYTPARTATAEDVAGFARCISESGATFYGAHWCPYCTKQNKAFGSSADRLPYVECYRSGSRDQLSRCDHIRSYPTWEFADGTVRTGYLSFEKLAALTDCPLP
jgi:hypothetical protein